MIVIRDEPCLHLGGLLDRLPVGAEALDWALLELWAFACDPDLDALALARRAEAAPTGLAITSRELRRLADQLLQVVDGILVGHRCRPPERSNPDLRDDAELVIEALDGLWWRVYAREERTLAPLRTGYREVKAVDPEIAIPAIHFAT